jgi:hypothetical protein
VIQVTLQFSSIAAAVSALARIDADAIVAGNPVPHAAISTGVTANEKAAVLLATEAAMADTVEAPGKPSAAPTARSPRTAAAAPSPSAPSDAAPAPAPTATPPAADASSAFDYAVLQKAVNAAVPKHGKDKLLAIAAKHGAKTFKDLQPAQWQAAHADVIALG